MRNIRTWIVSLIAVVLMSACSEIEIEGDASININEEHIYKLVVTTETDVQADSYQWEVISPAGEYQLLNASSSEVSFIPLSAGRYTLKVTVLKGRETEIAELEINVNKVVVVDDTNVTDTNTTQPPLVIDGHTLPPMPDKTLNDSTLLGIDSNDNGVRDDVERWIYITYNTHTPCTKEVITETLPNGMVIEGVVKETCEDRTVPYHQIVREIAMQGARAAQIIIQEPEKARETTHLMDSAQDCNIYFELKAGDYNESISLEEMVIGKEFDNVQFNTVERVRAYAKYNFALSGGVYSANQTDKEERDSCDFDVDKLLGK